MKMNTKNILEKELTFDIYIKKVMIHVHLDCMVSNETIQYLNGFINQFSSLIVKEAIILLNLKKQKTLTSREIQTVVRIILQNELAKHAVLEGTEAVIKYAVNNNNNNNKRQTRESKSGLQFSVSRIEKIIRFVAKDTRLGKGAPIYLAAVMEYLIAEILELSGNIAKENKKKIIKNKYVFLAISSDKELCHLFKRNNIEFENKNDLIQKL